MYASALLISIWQKLDQIDKYLFILLNNGTRNKVFDAIFPFLRDSVFWVPLYLFLLVFVLLNLKRAAPWWILGFLCTVGLTDFTGTYLFKQNVQRLRPCQDPSFFMHVHLAIKQCAGGFSFLSNHAANHFGMATFIALTFKNYLGPWVNLLFLWAFMIAFAQVYVGVHYPFDVLSGSILGICFGFITSMIFNKLVGRNNFELETI